MTCIANGSRWWFSARAKPLTRLCYFVNWIGIPYITITPKAVVMRKYYIMERAAEKTFFFSHSWLECLCFQIYWRKTAGMRIVRLSRAESTMYLIYQSTAADCFLVSCTLYIYRADLWHCNGTAPDSRSCDVPTNLFPSQWFRMYIVYLCSVQ